MTPKVHQLESIGISSWSSKGSRVIQKCGKNVPADYVKGTFINCNFYYVLPILFFSLIYLFFFYFLPGQFTAIGLLLRLIFVIIYRPKINGSVFALPGEYFSAGRVKKIFPSLVSLIRIPQTLVKPSSNLELLLKRPLKLNTKLDAFFKLPSTTSCDTLKYFPANIQLQKVNNGSTEKRCEMCSKATVKTPERRH